MHGLLSCNINAGVHAHVGGADVSLRDVTIAQMGNGVRECEWRHKIWKSQSSALGEDCWLSFARGGLVAGAHMWGGADGKVIIERLCISLPYVETFNSKVIKGFVPELRSCYLFFVFQDSYVLCIYVMNIICTFCIAIFMYGYVTGSSTLGRYFC